MINLKIAYAGTDEFAKRVLEKLYSNVDITSVITQPDRPRGRGKKLKATRVKKFAEDKGLPIVEIQKFNLEVKKHLKEYYADLMVVCSFGLYIPGWAVEIYPKGAINLHPSMLPKYRGAAPIQRALIAGEEQTAVAVIEIVEEMDAGDIYKMKNVEIKEDDNYQTLSNKLSKEGGELLLKVIKEIEMGTAVKKPQKGNPTYAEKISKRELEISWEKTAKQIHNKVRAFSPEPAAYFKYEGKRIKLLVTEICKNSHSGKPGEIIDIGKRKIHVAAGSGCIKLITVKPQNSRTMDAKSFANGYHLEVGSLLK